MSSHRLAADPKPADHRRRRLRGTGVSPWNTVSGGVGSVPARHTDLIFAVIGEELGFVGATLSILLLVAIIIRYWWWGRRATQPFHTYVCVGSPPW